MDRSRVWRYIGSTRKLTGSLVVASLVALSPAAGGAEEPMFELRLSSPAFDDSQPIPTRHSADGEDVSPPLDVASAPAGTVSFALVMDDPDAPMGTWVHWVVWNLPADLVRLGEGELPAGAVEGINSWGRTGYGGPAPPSGTHRYVFKLFALDQVLELGKTTDARALELAMAGHVVGHTELMGTYSRLR